MLEKKFTNTLILEKACIKSNRTSKQTYKNLLKTLISNIIYKVRDKNFSFIDDPQQRIYTVPRLE